MTTSKNKNNYEAQKLRGFKRKWEMVQERGGKCERCGYNKNLSAIEFHHVNSEEKDFALSSMNFSWSFERLVEETNKCILVCANCHREIHNPEYNMSL